MDPHLVPEEGCATHVQSVHLHAARCAAAAAVSGRRRDPEVQHGAPEVADVLRIHLAEIAEVVVSHEVRGRRLHGCHIQIPPLHDEVLVFPMHRAKPVEVAAPTQICTVLIITELVRMTKGSLNLQVANHGAVSRC